MPDQLASASSTPGEPALQPPERPKKPRPWWYESVAVAVLIGWLPLFLVCAFAVPFRVAVAAFASAALMLFAIVGALIAKGPQD